MALALGGCATPTSVESEYYLLNSSATADDAITLAPFSLGVGPVELADYLLPQGIAYHEDANRIVYSSQRRWAEPLDANISQVLLDNLIVLLPQQTVYPFPWKTTQNPDFQVKLQIIRFGWFPGGRVALEARITLQDASGKIRHTGSERIESVLAEESYEANVAAQNRLLATLSERLARTIETNVIAN